MMKNSRLQSLEFPFWGKKNLILNLYFLYMHTVLFILSFKKRIGVSIKDSKGKYRKRDVIARYMLVHAYYFSGKKQKKNWW